MQLTHRLLLICISASLLVAICAISSGSLWIDELETWMMTRADSLPAWWSQLREWPSSDSQMPIYSFYMYAWTRLAGTDAIAMRASNVAMFVVANLALLWPFRSRQLVAVSLVITLCLSAPLWYYLNEIRSYIMFFMGACLMIGATLELALSNEKTPAGALAIWCLGAVFSCAATVLGISWVGSSAGFILIYWLLIKGSSWRDLVRGSGISLSIAGFVIALVLAHDVGMFLRGARAVQLFETNVQTLMFSFYCNSGLLGIGPGMLDMRVNGAGALAPFAIPIAICGVFLFVVAVGGLLEVGKALPLPAVALLIACIFAPVAFTIMLGFLVHWRVLPRHLIPLVPLFSLLYAFGFAWWWRRRPTGRAIVLITVMIMAYSSLSVRFSPRQAKDDYRHAAELSAAELSHGGRVWWAADLWGARYYHIPYASGQLAWPDVADAGRVQGFLGAPPSILETLPAPSLVLLSKPELFDPDNRVQDYLTASHYRVVEVFPAFTAWRP